MRIRSLVFVLLAAVLVQPVAASAQMAGAVARPLQVLPPGMAVRFQRPATTFRWSDGDWVVRVGVSVTNMTGMPTMLHPRTFDCWANGQPMTYWAPAASLQGPQMVLPGQTVSGTLAWYYNRRMPQPMVAMVTSGGMAAMYRDNLPVVPGANTPPLAMAVPVAPSIGPVSPGVNFVFQPVGQTFRWSDGDWIARVTVTIVNGTPMPVQVDPSMFDAVANGQPMTDWSSAASMRGAVVLAPGQSTAGTLAWYYNRALPPPGAVMVTYRGAPWVSQMVVTPMAPMGQVPGAVR